MPVRAWASREARTMARRLEARALRLRNSGSRPDCRRADHLERIAYRLDQVAR